MSYNYNSNGWGDVDSREAHSTSYPDSDTEPYDGLEMRSSRPPTSPNTFGPATRKSRRPPPGVPFRQGPESTSYEYRQPSTSSTSSASSSSSSSSSSDQHCCSASSRRDPITGDHIRGEPHLHSRPLGRYDDPTAGEWVEPDWVEPLNSLSPRPNRKRDSGGRPGLKSNTRTSFTANGDRVEEYNGQGSLRIGTHWVDEDGSTVQAPTGLQARGTGRAARRDTGDFW